MAKTTTSEQYESAQNYNFLTKWFHSFRYKELFRQFEKLEKSHSGKPIKVFEIGAAYGRLYQLLNERFNIEYIGIELYEPLYKLAIERYGNSENAKFILGSCMDDNNWEIDFSPDVIVSLETLEHIPEHDVVRLIEKIAKAKPKYFICSVPVEIGPSIWFKNIGSFLSGYMRHKEYTWNETFWAGLYKLDKLPPHETGHKGFDWRWLAQTIRHNLKIKSIITFPFSFIPAGMASSVFIVSEQQNS